MLFKRSISNYDDLEEFYHKGHVIGVYKDMARMNKPKPIPGNEHGSYRLSLHDVPNHIFHHYDEISGDLKIWVKYEFPMYGEQLYIAKPRYGTTIRSSLHWGLVHTLDITQPYLIDKFGFDHLFAEGIYLGSSSGSKTRIYDSHRLVLWALNKYKDRILGKL